MSEYVYSGTFQRNGEPVDVEVHIRNAAFMAELTDEEIRLGFAAVSTPEWEAATTRALEDGDYATLKRLIEEQAAAAERYLREKHGVPDTLAEN